MKTHSKKIILVIGTRPNFVKIARLEKALRKEFELFVYHTGQHSSHKMSQWFIDFFKIEIDQIDSLPQNVCDSSTERFGIICKQFERYIHIKCRKGDIPDAIMVVGDVDSTFACAFVAKKLNIPIIHLESGLRSFDKNMPEEINRILTDRISDIKLVTDPIGVQNLLDEGCAKTAIDTFWVGNTMIDTLRWLDRYHLAAIDPKNIRYNIIATFHRPENVDDRIEQIIKFLDGHKWRGCGFCLCTHPRFENNVGTDKLNKIRQSGINIVSQPSYLEFIKLLKGCMIVLTDSGGVQEEAAYFNKPTITIRNNTERPVTTYINDNLITPDLDLAKKHINKFLSDDLHDENAYYIKHNLYHKMADFYSDHRDDEKKLYWKNNASREIVNVLRKVLNVR